MDLIVSGTVPPPSESFVIEIGDDKYSVHEAEPLGDGSFRFHSVLPLSGDAVPDNGLVRVNSS